MCCLAFRPCGNRPGVRAAAFAGIGLQGIRPPLIDKLNAEERRPGRPRVDGGLARWVVRSCNFRRPNSQKGIWEEAQTCGKVIWNINME